MPVLEQKLARLFGFEYAVMMGRARSGLVALIETFTGINKTPVPVLLPENICPVLVTAIRAGGGIAVTVPVSPENGLPDDQAFVRAMKESDRPGIVSPAHLYGFLADYTETIKLAREKGWFILENDSNAVRMQTTEPAFGDALLVSFGYAKPLEIGTGGALLTNDRALAEAIGKRVAGYSLLNEGSRALEAETMLKRRALRKKEHVPAHLLAQICQTETDLSCFRFDPEDTDLLVSKLDHFPEEVARRCERKSYWDQALEPLNDILKPVSLKQPVPWRLIRRVPKGRHYIAECLWQKNIDAGINYRSLWRELPGDYLTGKSSPLDPWGEIVLNLWVTKDYDQAHIMDVVDILKGAVDER